MESKPHIFTYPEEYMVYWELEAERADFNLPYYFARKIKDISEELDAKIYVGIWWPYAYITLIRELEKEVEECVQKELEGNREDNERQCKETCGDDEKCVEECMNEIHHIVWRSCEENIANDLRPLFLEAAREIESEAEIYGIVAKTHVMSDGEGLKLKIRLEGYSEIIPLDLGKTLFTQMLNVTMTRYYTNVEKFSHDIAASLIKYYGLKGFVKLIQSIDKSKMYISHIYDNLPYLRKYDITLEYNDDRINFFITEERKNDKWVVTDVIVRSILSPIADLTPA
jgi:hypothetical protein